MTDPDRLLLVCYLVLAALVLLFRALVEGIDRKKLAHYVKVHVEECDKQFLRICGRFLYVWLLLTVARLG